MKDRIVDDIAGLVGGFVGLANDARQHITVKRSRIVKVLTAADHYERLTDRVSMLEERLRKFEMQVAERDNQ